jgi:hypothetical protein
LGTSGNKHRKDKKTKNQELTGHGAEIDEHFFKAPRLLNLLEPAIHEKMSCKHQLRPVARKFIKTQETSGKALRCFDKISKKNGHTAQFADARRIVGESRKGG